MSQFLNKCRATLGTDHTVMVKSFEDVLARLCSNKELRNSDNQTLKERLQNLRIQEKCDFPPFLEQNILGNTFGPLCCTNVMQTSEK